MQTLTSSSSLDVPDLGTVQLTVTERGEGRPVLLLHGGGGPQTVVPWAEHMTAQRHARVLTPIHPGFGGTPRPEQLDSIGALAATYVALLDYLDVHDVTVVGNSIGGWIAAELALRQPPRLGRIALVDAVGIQVDGHPGADFDSLTPAQVAEHSWFDPSKAPVVDPATMPAVARTVLLGNRAALATYGGTSADPTLLGRLADVRVPALVVWGEADRIVDVDYGRAYAAAIPEARFVLLPRTGHVPQLETPEALLAALSGFVTA